MAIRTLDADTIAQIAAGEVIERPASVVKELVENSLDAGATRIAVELVDGGKSAISVSDDGEGMAPDDLSAAVCSHATSKLRTFEDLRRVDSLGFRGEGLASIAAAGRVSLTSRRKTDDFGAQLEAEGTQIGEVYAVAAPPGTKVVVRDLFFATPARRRNLKGAAAEFTRVSAFLSRISLGWPQVGFSLRHDGRDVWNLPPAADAADRLHGVFGKTSVGALLKIVDDAEFSRERVGGYIGAPGDDRATRSDQVFFVNGRLVRAGGLAAAWLAGYAGFGMTGRFPFGLLRLELPPEDVDVNVHPMKAEVRFVNNDAVFHAVRRAVARTMQSAEPVKRFEAISYLRPQLQQNDPHAGAPETGGVVGFRPPGAVADSADLAGARSREAVPAGGVLLESDFGGQECTIFGQIDRSYIAACDRVGLLLIDQHAAHERIAFEALLAQATHVEPVAPLLFPSTIELSALQAETLQRYAEHFAAAGIEAEPFGDRTYRVRSLPSGYDKRRFDLAAMLDELSAEYGVQDFETPQRRVLATIACHSVVRAHEQLAPSEQASLYERLLRCPNRHTCPHGRPTMLRLDVQSLAKAFRRT